MIKLNHIDKKRLILIDLDGTTLMDDGKTMHPLTIQGLQKTIAQGHIVCIVTGRPHRGSISFYNELGLKTLLCNFNGGHIHDPLLREFKRLVFPISYDTVKAVLKENDVKTSLYNGLLEYYNKAVCLKQTENFERYFHLTDIPTDNFIIGNLLENWSGSANNIVLQLKSPQHLDKVIRSLEKYTNTLKINIWTHDNDKEHPVLDLSNKFINKGMAAEILSQYYNIDIRDVIAFGDEFNDLEMITKVGYGIVMKNGIETLKVFSKDITEHTNDEGGVGIYLEKLLNL